MNGGVILGGEVIFGGKDVLSGRDIFYALSVVLVDGVILGGKGLFEYLSHFGWRRLVNGGDI